MDMQAAGTPKGDIFEMASVQSTEQPRTFAPGSSGQDTWLDIPLAGVFGNALSREQWRLVLDDVGSNLEKISDCELLRL